MIETWRCDYCGRANRETTLSCEGCGASMPERKNRPVEPSAVPVMEFGNPEPVGWIAGNGKIYPSIEFGSSWSDIEDFS